MTEPDDLAKAANLLRAHGYAIVTQVEKDNWDQWLKQAQERNRHLWDVQQRLIWQVLALTDHCAELLEGSRPMWFRAARRFIAKSEYDQPLVFPETSSY